MYALSRLAQESWRIDTAWQGNAEATRCFREGFVAEIALILLQKSPSEGQS
jgi:hypothetical protein